jgi:hypothetical protein
MLSPEIGAARNLIDPEDPLVALALTEGEVSRDVLEGAMKKENKSLFGKILLTIVSTQ